ncbi:MAG: hypothetical protein D9V47_05810 [Clostridia bacterium]|nr:MAG: hypothetical protein D9V47_05810 [Clostridia bacterium]
MDWELWKAIIRLAIFLPVVMFLAYWAVRYGLGYRNGRMSHSRQMRLLEQIAIGPKSYLSIVKVVGHYYLIATGEGGTRLLRELEEYGGEVEDDGAGRAGIPWPVNRWLDWIARFRDGREQ